MVLMTSKTWEKAIYHLLIKYRNKHLENYNMDEEEDAAARARRQARKSAGAPSPAKRKGGTGPMVAKQPGLAPLGENETIQPRAASPSPMSRPQAPTPKKASGGQVEESPISKAKQQPPKSPGGPRPPVSRGNSTASQAPRLEMPGTPGPTITLQEATPTKEVLAANVTARPRSGMSSPGPAESPSLPLNVPQVQDERLQHFFNEVANQLNTMNIRSSVVSTSSNGSGSAILGSDYQAYLAYAAGVNSPIGPLSPTLGHGNGLEVGVDPNQFADADDDHSEVASIVSSVQPGRQSPHVGLGLGGPPYGPRPGLHPAQSQNTNRWSYASSTGSSHRGSIYPVESPMQSPALSFGGAQEFIGSTQPLQATRPAPFPPPRGASRLAPTRPAPSTPPTSVPSTLESKRTSTLPRDESFVVIDSDTPNDPSLNSWNSRYSANRGQDAFGMLKRRKKNLSNIEPTPFMPSLSGPSSATSTSSSVSGKRSWFNNLFSFKPASFTLMSSDNIGNTRERAKKLLSGMGCRVEIVEVDGLRALKCRYDDVKGMSSIPVKCED
jgi:serine/threonine-protein kinase HSL1 (negative regulator of Swe1 kinase)